MKIVLATGNLGKVKELSELLSSLNIEVLPQSQFNVPDVPETGTTFIENAIIKARHAAKLTGLPAIADDSGLEVDALQGAPGIYSARYAGEYANDDDNMNKLLADMADIPAHKKSARFHCVLVFMMHAEDPTPLICHGTWEGSIISEKTGKQGFGYDPIFWDADQGMTSAQLPRDIKNTLSHRSKALAKLLPTLSDYIAGSS